MINLIGRVLRWFSGHSEAHRRRENKSSESTTASQCNYTALLMIPYNQNWYNFGHQQMELLATWKAASFGRKRTSE